MGLEIFICRINSFRVSIESTKRFLTEGRVRGIPVGGYEKRENGYSHRMDSE